MGGILIITGIAIWFFWANDIQKGIEDSGHRRLVHNHPIGGCLPYIIAFGLIAVGIYLLIE